MCGYNAALSALRHVAPPARARKTETEAVAGW
jgi:hypothetical protein